MLEAVALAFGLAMDATAVCAARSLGVHARRELVILPLLFGAFQAGMAALGWLGGNWARSRIAEWDHWIAGGLLVVIALHMIIEAWRGEPAGSVDAPASADSDGRAGAVPVLLYLGLAIATSIDAAAAGLTLPLIPVPSWLVLTLIGVVTSLCCAVGYAAGRALGSRFGPRLGLLGGVVLIAIAIDILIRQP